METSDAQVLKRMKLEIDASRAAGLNLELLSERLLSLRDQLQFTDREWFHELTQNIATIDSASSFSPADDDQTRQVRSAVTTATDNLLRLIDRKLGVRRKVE